MLLRYIALFLFLPFIGHAQIQNLESEDAFVFSEEAEPDKNYFSPFNFSLGGNIDPDLGKFRGLYISVNAFVPDLVKFGKMGLGFDAGVRRSYARFFNSGESTVSIVNPVVIEEVPYKETTQLTRYTSHFSKNTQLYFNPTFKLLTRKDESGTKACQLFFSVDFDMLIQQVNKRYSHDTLSVSYSFTSLSEFVSLEQERIRIFDIYDQVVYSARIGLPFILENEWGLVKGKVDVGLSNVGINGGNSKKSVSNYGLAIEIIEKKYGLHLRSEVRFVADRDPPFISVGLAKYFNFKNKLKFYPSA